MVVLDALEKRYGRTLAVNQVSLEIAPGEFFSLLGPSGCGKTTTLRLLAGFEHPDRGQVRIGGQPVTHLPPERRPIGMVFQNYALFPNMTVEGNVAFPLRIRGLPAAEVRQRVGHLLETVHLLGLEHRFPRELSGGQQQRVALARALAKDPKVLLLDEPLSALDAKIREELRSELKRLQQETGLTTIYVTHDQEEALALSDRVAVMREARLEQVGTPMDIYLRPRSSFVARFVGSGTLVEGEAREGRFYFRGQPWPVQVEGQGPGYLLLRPEQLAVSPQGFLPGRVRLVTYLGSSLRVEVEYDGLTIKADLPISTTLRIGESIGLVLPEQGIFVEGR